MFGSGPAERKKSGKELKAWTRMMRVYAHQYPEVTKWQQVKMTFVRTKLTHLEPCEMRMSAMWHAREKIVRDARFWWEKTYHSNSERHQYLPINTSLPCLPCICVQRALWLLTWQTGCGCDIMWCGTTQSRSVQVQLCVDGQGGLIYFHLPTRCTLASLWSDPLIIFREKKASPAQDPPRHRILVSLCYALDWKLHSKYTQWTESNTKNKLTKNWSIQRIHRHSNNVGLSNCLMHSSSVSFFAKFVIFVAQLGLMRMSQLKTIALC